MEVIGVAKRLGFVSVAAAMYSVGRHVQSLQATVGAAAIWFFLARACGWAAAWCTSKSATSDRGWFSKKAPVARMTFVLVTSAARDQRRIVRSGP
eukprot:13466669-Alexandrium_andersonii.AAC.1